MTTDQLPPFSEWITDHAQGVVDDEMTVELAALVESVSHLRRKGELTLKIVVEPAGEGGRSVSTACEVSAKPPKPAPEQSIFFVGEGGSLHRKDPFQGALNLKRVERPNPNPPLPNTTGDDQS